MLRLTSVDWIFSRVSGCWADISETQPVSFRMFWFVYVLNIWLFYLAVSLVDWDNVEVSYWLARIIPSEVICKVCDI